MPLSEFPETGRQLSTSKKIGIALALICSVLLALIGLIATIALFANWASASQTPLLLAAIGAAVVTALLFWLSYFFFSFFKKPAPPAPSFCQCCGRGAPTIKVGLNRHIGAVVLMFHKTLNGYFCRSCIRKTFWEYTPITFFFGGWGLLSMIITPIVLINNGNVFIRSMSMPSDEPDSPDESRVALRQDQEG